MASAFSINHFFRLEFVRAEDRRRPAYTPVFGRDEHRALAIGRSSDLEIIRPVAE
jgi:hypothetical protein